MKHVCGNSLLMLLGPAVHSLCYTQNVPQDLGITGCQSSIGAWGGGQGAEFSLGVSPMAAEGLGPQERVRE